VDGGVGLTSRIWAYFVAILLYSPETYIHLSQGRYEYEYCKVIRAENYHPYYNSCSTKGTKEINIKRA
jgi:hypothetical protein